MQVDATCYPCCDRGFIRLLHVQSYWKFNPTAEGYHDSGQQGTCHGGGHRSIGVNN